MKSSTIATIFGLLCAALVVKAEQEVDEGCPRQKYESSSSSSSSSSAPRSTHNKKPTCTNPCDLSPPVTGLGRCECPKACSSLWFGSCTGVNGAFCQDYFLDCNVQCDDGSRIASKATNLVEIPTGYSVKGVCVSFDSYDRPGCFLPNQEAVWSGNCADLEGSTLVVTKGRYTCIQASQDLLLPATRANVCPKGYYPTCYIIKDTTF